MLAATSRLVLKAVQPALARSSSSLATPRNYSIASSSSQTTVLDFEKHCEESLHRITDYLDTFPEWLDCSSEFDVNFAMGVITAKISPEVGTYVINKQSPNLQIWLSSPISGPKRYDLRDKKWVYSHDNMIAATRRLCSMRSWQCESFGAESLLKTRPTPEISTPNDVLLKVKASSVNNIDVMMRRGYGNEMFTRWRQLQYCQWEPPSRLPITVGRDCSAVVEAVGGNVTRFKPGDEVIAVVEPIYQGTHAEYTIANEAYCAPKPTNLSHVECAALPYVACTNWAALVSIAQIKPFQAHSQRVLIHGGAGGMGTTAIQLLRAWGCEHIVATCSADSFKTVKELGAIPLDYSDAKIRDQIIAQGPFDVILDCVDTELARWSDTIMGIWRNSVHVSVVAPLLQDTDRYGVNVGLLSTAIKHFTRSVESAVRGRWYSYAFFMPNSDCMSQLSTFLQEGQVKPIIDEVFSFEEVPKAYEKVGQLKGRGKTVIDFEKSSN